MEAQAREIAQSLPVLNGALADNDWVAGPLTIADFALASTFMAREPAGISLAEVPHVAGWIERMEQRPSWQKATGEMPNF